MSREADGFGWVMYATKERIQKRAHDLEAIWESLDRGVLLDFCTQLWEIHKSYMYIDSTFAEPYALDIYMEVTDEAKSMVHTFLRVSGFSYSTATASWVPPPRWARQNLRINQVRIKYHRYKE